MIRRSCTPGAGPTLKPTVSNEVICRILMIVKNYTGDKLNFGLAAIKARASGLNVEVVVVGDDVSVANNPTVGRRGLAGVVFVHKVAGALAAKGADLSIVTNVANKTANQIATAAVSLDRCSVPKRAPIEPLPFDEVEFGMGIHNEPGVTRSKLQSVEVTVSTLLDILLASKPDSWYPSQAQPVAVMVNNLGGLSPLEISVIAEEVHRQLDLRSIIVKRFMFGTFVTALDGPGFSITLLGLDDEILSLLDAPTTAPGWPKLISTGFYPDVVIVDEEKLEDNVVTTSSHAGPKVIKSTIINIITNVANTTREDEPLITEYDTLAGDGDCGETLLNGINGLIELSKRLDTNSIYLAHMFRQIAVVAETKMGGTSGAIYAIFINAVAEALENIHIHATSNKQSISKILSTALRKGLEDLFKFTTAREGHRTLMDVLIPFVTTFNQTNQDFEVAFEAAKQGCEKTKVMEALLGRASYVGKSRFEYSQGY
ncbi:Dihydroxyacetone kinase 2 [Talaromyces marneffei ATCC 18224]